MYNVYLSYVDNVCIPYMFCMPTILLNFIEIHSKNLQKTFAFGNLNPYLVFPKHCNFVHLKNSSVIQENWREEDCLNQRYTLI